MLNINNDNWRPVTGFEQEYLVSKTGQVYGLKHKKLKSSRPTTNSDYLYVKASKDNKMKTLSVHRMVAQAFIPNPDNKPMVNHIDGNKLNNNVCNLEWVTCSENHKHAYTTGLKESPRAQLGVKAGNSSQYNNVCWDKSRGKWKAFLKNKGKVLFQKRFDSEVEAAEYVNRMLEHYGLTDRPKNIIN